MVFYYNKLILEIFLESIDVKHCLGEKESFMLNLHAIHFNFKRICL